MFKNDAGSRMIRHKVRNVFGQKINGSAVIGDDADDAPFAINPGFQRFHHGFKLPLYLLRAAVDDFAGGCQFGSAL